jgi:hypothetical protein
VNPFASTNLARLPASVAKFINLEASNNHRCVGVSIAIVVCVKSRITASLGAIASLALVLSGCSSSVDGSGGTSLDFVPADVIEGVWAGQLSLVRSNGPEVITHPVLEIEIESAGDGLFKYDRRVETTEGTRLMWKDGLGSISPSGQLQTTEPGEVWLMAGYLQDENTLIVQMSEFAETGQEVSSESTTFAGLATLTKQD